MNQESATALAYAECQLIPAAQYRLRSLQLERRTLQEEGAILSRGILKAIDLISGHGEKPGRIIISYLIVVLAGSCAIPLASSYGDESAVAVATPYLLLTAFYLW